MTLHLRASQVVEGNMVKNYPAFDVGAELKMWDRLRVGMFAARMRREQIRYHAVCAKQDRPTLIVWGTPDSDHVWLRPGHLAPHTVTSRIAPDARGNFCYAPWQREIMAQHIAMRLMWRGWLDE